MSTLAWRNELADCVAENFPWISLHTANPGSTGSNELSGGSPAYERRLGAWSPPSSGEVQAVADFDVPAATITHIGLWSAATGGSFGRAFQLPQAIVTSGQSVRRVTAIVTGKA